jgi:MOSC domain-containing protein YiiM
LPNNTGVEHLALAQLEAALDTIRETPKCEGVLSLIVRRPTREAREVLEEGMLTPDEGLVGDSWKERATAQTSGGKLNTATQLTLMNSRVVALLAQSQERWQLAGDQLYVDLDLGLENLPPGTRLAIGSALVEVTAEPHTGCKKFVSRFGMDAMLFVNSPVGRQLCLRGINARVLEPGTVRVGDRVKKVAMP